eukprot:5826477-Prymnesium_polylepis.1
MLTPRQQRQIMDKHVEDITQMLNNIQRKYADSEFRVLLAKLCIQKLEFADPDRTAGEWFGECSIDLKMRWRLVKHDKDGSVAMKTEWFTCYTIALDSAFADPRVPMHCSDIWGTVSNQHGALVTSKKLSTILANAHEHWEYQGLGKHTDLTQHAEVLVGSRASLVWTPNDDESKDGWTVETQFSEFCYQDSGQKAQQNGPTSFGVVMGPKGSVIYSGRPGQLDMPYKFVDKVTGHLMNYPTKVNASDRAIETDGSVREQTDEEKAKTLTDDPTRGVQLKIGVNGIPRASNMEIVIFGQQTATRHLSETTRGVNDMSFFGGWYDDDTHVHETLGGAECDEIVYRSLGCGAPDSSFGWGAVVEAELGLSDATGRADALSVENIKSDSKKNLVLTQYKKWSLPFGTVPGEDFLHGVVSDLISMWQACEKPPDGMKGPKTSLGLVESRHGKKARVTFSKGESPNYQDIESSFQHYNTNAKDLLPAEDIDSDDDDMTLLAKAQKLKSEHHSSSSQDGSDWDED